MPNRHEDAQRVLRCGQKGTDSRKLTIFQYVANDDRFAHKIARNEEIMRSVDSPERRVHEAESSGGKRIGHGTVKVVTF